MPLRTDTAQPINLTREAFYLPNVGIAGSREALLEWKDSNIKLSAIYKETNDYEVIFDVDISQIQYVTGDPIMLMIRIDDKTYKVQFSTFKKGSGVQDWANQLRGAGVVVRGYYLIPWTNRWTALIVVIVAIVILAVIYTLNQQKN